VSATPTSQCDRATFVGDVTIQDNTVLRLNQPFTKTWRLRNDGTCGWTTGYKMVFVSGDQMGAPAAVALPHNVAAGQTLDVSVSFTAPELAGHYQGYWQLQTADGKNFGVGKSATDQLWVKVRVIEPAYATDTLTPTMTATPLPPTSTPTEVPPTATPSPTATTPVQYDFTGNACAAQWQSNTGILPCPV
jgi:hypothetical protein